MPASATAAASRPARTLWWASLFFAGLGAGLPLLFGTAFFALYRGAVAAALGGAASAWLAPGAALAPVCSLLLGITGGTIAGKWIAHAALARYALAGGERWARNASLAGLLVWFTVDSATSLARGAAFNVALINWAPLGLFGLPLALAWKQFDQAPAGQVDPHMQGVARLCELVCLLGAASGIVIAAGGTSALFAPWYQSLAIAYSLDGPQSLAARHLTGFFLGPIGGSTAGQFVLLAAIARHALPRRRPWAIPAMAASVLGWFLIDSGYGLMFGGIFNLALINVPTLALTLPTFALAARRLRRAAL